MEVNKDRIKAALVLEGIHPRLADKLITMIVEKINSPKETRLREMRSYEVLDDLETKFGLGKQR